MDDEATRSGERGLLGPACRLGFGEAADLAGDAEEVVVGVQRVVCGVELVEYGADERRLADVLGHTDPLGVGGERDRRVGLVAEADRGCVQRHGRDSTHATHGNRVASRSRES